MPYRLAIALCRLLDEVYTICFHFAIPNLKNFKKVYEIKTISVKSPGKHCDIGVIFSTLQQKRGLLTMQ